MNVHYQNRPHGLTEVFTTNTNDKPVCSADGKSTLRGKETTENAMYTT